MRIESDLKLGFKDVLFRPKRSSLKSRSEVNLSRTYRFFHANNSWTGVPIIAANMDSVGTFSMAKSLAPHGLLVALHKHYSFREWEAALGDSLPQWAKNILISSGTSDHDFVQLEKLLTRWPELAFICLDVANGYAEAFVNFVSRVRERFPEKIIVAGNVVTPEMTEELILKGADIVKVGIGPGSVCTTRVKTGVGYPQLSAIIECADAAHGLKGHVIADGGCTTAGDVSKAFGAGGDFVMLGGMLAGHEESETSVVEKDGKLWREFYGMSSKAAMEKYAGGVQNYRASEGKSVLIEDRGKVEQTILDILGGVRSTCTYVGAAELRELSKRTTFIRVNEQENRVYK